MRLEIKKWLDGQDATAAWLEAHYQGRKSYQTGRNIRFVLTFSQYVELWGMKRLKQVAKLIAAGRIARRMRHPEKGWVLSWISKKARKAGEMNFTTARILQRNSSKYRFYLKAGDTHNDEAKRRIGDAKRGKPLSKGHKEAIRDARLGVSQSEEHKAKRIAAIRATKQRKREERLAPAARTIEATV
uniref:hypothetical protein n=1 Tax=Methylobacterium sp. B34 TaxID=95563 RepID=UPI0009FDA5F1|nr:hypothetical protein [Methylobacterium sp. B34]